MRPLLLIMLTCCMALQGFAFTQMERWALPPYQINFDGTPTVSTISGASSGIYTASNGAYDENGNLLFYVKDNYVYTATSTSVGTLTDFSHEYSPGVYYSYTDIADEIAIVPIPSECDKYYVIFFKSQPYIGMALLYSIVDMSSGSPVVTSTHGYDPSPMLLGYYSGNHGGIAVSRPINSSNDRYLYSIAYSEVERRTITSSGFSGKTTLLDYSSGASFQPIEADLTHDGNKLAWASSDYPINVYDIPSATLSLINIPVDGSCTSPTSIYYNGVEFDANGNLYVGASSSCTANRGIFKIAASGGSISKISGSEDYVFSQLELGNDGYIYAINYNTSKLGTFSPTGGSMSASSITVTVTSNSYVGTGSAGGPYRLPDQIDGDQYFYFKGVSTSYAEFDINGQAVSSTPLELFNCNPITMTNLSTNVYEYLVEIKSTDASGNPISGGGALGTYSSGWLSYFPSNLLSLPGTNGTWLANPANAGYYTITLKTRNACSDESEYSGRIHLNTPPTAASMNLQINNGITGTPCYTQNIASVCPTGAYSATYNIGTSTFGSNNITSYFRKIYKVDCSTGANISVVYTDFSPVPVPNPSSSATALSLNAISISGGTGYFTNKVGECYKLTITVYNQCSNAVDWTFFEIDGYYKNDGTTGIVNEVALTNELNVYPNPFSSNVQIALSLANDSPVSAYLMDAQGKIVRAVVENEPLAAGEHMLNISGDDLAGGIYMYKVVTNTNTYSGRVLKAE